MMDELLMLSNTVAGDLSCDRHDEDEQCTKHPTDI